MGQGAQDTRTAADGHSDGVHSAQAIENTSYTYSGEAAGMCMHGVHSQGCATRAIQMHSWLLTLEATAGRRCHACT